VALKSDPSAQGPESALPSYYADTARMRIQQNFIAMRHQRADRQCDVAFVVLRNGEITNVRIVRSTGDESLDRLALAAMERTRKLAALPSFMRVDSVQLIVTFDFDQE